MNMDLVIRMIFNSTLVGSLVAILILGIRKALNIRVRAKWMCALWFILIIRLLVPYIPNSPLNLSQVSGLSHDLTRGKGAIVVARIDGFDLLSGSLIKTTNPLFNMLFFVWLSGVVIFVFYMIVMNVLFLRKAICGQYITDEHVLRILDECKTRIGLDKDVNILSVHFLKTPAVFGLIKPLLLIPEGILTRSDEKDLRNILLHELTHLKRKDILINCVISLVQVFHWFNPVIGYAFKIMRTDREMACDEYVLSSLEEEDRKSYAGTILSLMAMQAGPRCVPGLAAMVESRKSSIERLKRIIAFKGSGRCSRFVFMILLMISVSFIGVNAYELTTESVLGPAQPIEESCYDPRTTAAQSFSPVTRVMPDVDNVIMTDIKSTEKLVDGIETFIVVEVEYSLTTQDNARLCILFNNGSLSTVFVHKGMVSISKGTGKYIFTIPIVPINQKYGKNFGIRCSLHTDNGSLFDYERELMVDK